MDPFVLATFIVAFLAMLIGIVAILFTLMEHNTNKERAARHGHKVKCVLDAEIYSPSQLKPGLETENSELHLGNVVALFKKDKSFELYHVNTDGGDIISQSHTHYTFPKNHLTQPEMIIVSSKPTAQRDSSDTIANAAFVAYQTLLSQKISTTLTTTKSEVYPNPNRHKTCETSVCSVRCGSDPAYDVINVEVIIHYINNETEKTDVPFNPEDEITITVPGFFVSKDGTIKGDKTNPSLQIANPKNVLGKHGATLKAETSGNTPTIAERGDPTLELYAPTDATGDLVFKIFVGFADGTRRPVKYFEFFRFFAVVGSDTQIGFPDLPGTIDATIRLKGLFTENGK